MDDFSLCNQLSHRKSDQRTLAIRALAALPAAERMSLLAPSGHYAGWSAIAIAARCALNAKNWPSGNLTRLLKDLAVADLSRPDPDAMPLGVWFWLGSLRRAHFAWQNSYHDNRYFDHRSLLGECWGEVALRSAVLEAVPKLEALGNKRLNSLISDACFQETRRNVGRAESGDVFARDALTEQAAGATHATSFGRPLFHQGHQSIVRSLKEHPEVWWPGTAGQRFWWTFLSAPAWASSPLAAHVVLALVQNGFEPSPEEARAALGAWGGLDAHLDAELEFRALVLSLPCATTARHAVRL